MRGVNFYSIFILCMVCVGVGYAASEPDQEESAEQVKEVVVPGLQNEVINQPIVAKKIYRESWKNDNVPKMNTVEQLEYIEKNVPGLDPDTKAIMRGGIKMMKKMNFGTKNKNIEDITQGVQENPAQAIQELSEGVNIELDEEEFFNIMKEMEEPMKRMREKLYQDKGLEKTDYTIDVNAF